MTSRRLIPWLLVLAIFTSMPAQLLAMYTVDRIAEERKEIPAELARHWNLPGGAIDLLNDSLRTIGWSEWFSDLPNDGRHFAFKVSKPSDVQHLIDVFAAIKSEKLIVRLAAENGPIDPSAGNQSRLPGAQFSIGNQKAIDAWFKRLPEIEPGVRKFGIHRLTEPQQALPPTLTIYVEHEHVSLDRLQIPRHVNLDTEFGFIEAGKPAWKWDSAKKDWGSPPKPIVDFLERHRQQQAADKGKEERR